MKNSLQKKLLASNLQLINQNTIKQPLNFNQSQFEDAEYYITW